MSEALTAARVYLSLPDADVAECRAALLAMRERLVAEYNQLNDGRFMGQRFARLDFLDESIGDATVILARLPWRMKAARLSRPMLPKGA